MKQGKKRWLCCDRKLRDDTWHIRCKNLKQYVGWKDKIQLALEIASYIYCLVEKILHAEESNTERSYNYEKKEVIHGEGLTQKEIVQYTGAVHGECYIQQGTTLKAGFYIVKEELRMERSSTRRGVRHGKEYACRGINYTRRLVEPRASIRREMAAQVAPGRYDTPTQPASVHRGLLA